MQSAPATPPRIPGFYHHPGVNPACLPFARLHGHARVVVLVHGLTGSPFDFRDFADAYERAGYDVVVPLLPGHGSHISRLERLTFRELYIPFEPLFDYLRPRYAHIHLVGLSYGAVLTANLALQRTADTVSFLAPAFYLTHGSERNMRLVRRLGLQHFKSRMSKARISGNKAFRPHPFTYAHIPFLPATDLHARTQQIRLDMAGRPWRVYHAHGDADDTTAWEENHAFLKQTFADYTFYPVAGGAHVLPLTRGAADLAADHLAWLERAP